MHDLNRTYPGRNGANGWIGLFYSMDHSTYTCTVYANVTGKKKSHKHMAGIAQAPVQAVLEMATVASSTTTQYQNPLSGPCKGAADVGQSPHLNERNASNITVLLSQLPNGQPNPDPDRHISGAVCAPRCGCMDPVRGSGDCKQFVECAATNLPTGTTATPQCILGVIESSTHTEGILSTACALVCDPSQPDGGPASKCPLGATCQRMYGEVAAAEAGIFDTGICTY
jgi:hypothetical protein